MSRTERFLARAYWFSVRAKNAKERVLRLIQPSRMRFVTYSWPFMPDVCPCDLHFSDYLRDRNVRGRAVFHLGPGGHHLVGLRNQQDGLQNQVLAITASPAEHNAYVRRVIRDPALGASYRVLFGDIYNLTVSSLPAFDVVSLFHLGEPETLNAPDHRLDERGVVDLFISKLNVGGRVVFHELSAGRPRTWPAVELAAAEGRIAFEERYQSLAVYRVVTA